MVSLSGIQSWTTFLPATTLTTAFTGVSIVIPIRYVDSNNSGPITPQSTAPRAVILGLTFDGDAGDANFLAVVESLRAGETAYRHMSDYRWVIASPGNVVYTKRWFVYPLSPAVQKLRVRAKLGTAGGTGTLKVEGRIGVATPFAY
ncbi:MAG: hypothetical protein IPH13_20010 [Planctomycetes bacterium]|nr:hypothetical protein [Planctomycetota bacterium]